MGNLNYPHKTAFMDNAGKEKVINFSSFEKAFSKYAKDGFLTQQSFNDCIVMVLNDEFIPKIGYTHLSERLFNLLDKDRLGKINYEAFAKGFCNALSNQEMRNIIIFEAIKNSPTRTYLDFDELYNFFLQSWISGFNYVFSFISHYFMNEFTKNGIPMPKTKAELNSLVTKHQDDLKAFLVKSLYDSSIEMNEPIYYDAFRKWLLKDNTIEITYANKMFRFATSLSFLEKIGLNIEK